MTTLTRIAADHRRDYDPIAQAPLWAVRLVDRRTGQFLRINGAPLLAISRRPREAAAEMLDGRNPDLWEARIEPLSTTTRQ